MLIRVVMFGCIRAGSLCSIVSVLSCVERGSVLYISCGLSAVTINEELIIIIIIIIFFNPRGFLKSPRDHIYRGLKK